MHLQPPLYPRSGDTLEVLGIERISTDCEDSRTLGDQATMVEKYVRDRYPHPTRFDHIQRQGSGSALDGQELADAEAAVASGRYDLVIVVSLDRIDRWGRMFDLCKLCMDSGTRLIAITDSIDTANDGWQVHALFAGFKHESGAKETANRIRRSLRKRFEQGGMLHNLPFGYLKRPGARLDADITKDPAAESVYEKIFSMLESGAGYAKVADALNADKVPFGQRTRSVQWTGGQVARIVHNPMVKGIRQWNRWKNVYASQTGRRFTVKAPPDEMLHRSVPHLQFIAPARYDRLIKMLAECARGRKAG